jgi:class 3 adenylate cyclase/tetratricopeptide (TPR) repeat protein
LTQAANLGLSVGSNILQQAGITLPGTHEETGITSEQVVESPPSETEQWPESISTTEVLRPEPSPFDVQLDKYIPGEMREKLSLARSRGEMVGERRVVTMLFCDIQGSTAAAEQLDPEEWTEIINSAFEPMIRPVYKYEGTVARLTGDGILAFFGAPIAHEDDPQRAVLAGLEIVAGIKLHTATVKKHHGFNFDVRVGINTGLVVVGTVGSDLRMEYTAMGDAINLAARMEQTAEPGTVRIAEDTYKLISPFFEVEKLGALSVKGKEQAVSAYRVLGRKVVTGRQRGIEGLHAEIVGRNKELDTLRDVLASAQQGVGRIVTVIGEAGLGKSRLIRELSLVGRQEQPVIASKAGPDEEAIFPTKETNLNPISPGLQWFETASLSYETAQPYALFQRLIRRFNNIGPADPSDIIRKKLAIQLEQFDEAESHLVLGVYQALFDLADNGNEPPLEGEAFKNALFNVLPLIWKRSFADHPAILVFDDIHWSDPASIDLLLHLFPLTAEIPLVLLCAFRPDRNAAVWQLKMVADAEFHHRYTEINLHPLSDGQVNELVDGLLTIADLPDSLRGRIMDRANGNPFFVEEVVRDLIDSGSIVAEERIEGGQVQLHWQATGDGQGINIPDNLQSLLAARIDRLEEETKYILQTAAVIGRSFYRRVLEAIEDQGNGTGVNIDRHLRLLLRIEMIREAARLPELEYKFSNPLTQEVAYQTILLKHRRTLHRRVGETLELLFPEQLTELAPLLAYHFTEADLADRAFYYHLSAGNAAARLFANLEAVDHFDKAHSLIDRTDINFDQLTSLYTGRSRALELLNRYEDSLENYEAMLDLAQKRGDKKLELAALMAQATIRSVPSQVFDPDISLQLSENALILAHELDEPSAEAKIHWNMLLRYMWGSFDFEQAVIHGEAARTIAEESSLDEEIAYILNDLATALMGIGKMNTSLEVMEEARDLLEEKNDLPLLALNLTNSGMIYFLTGKNEEANRYFDKAVEINGSIDNVWGLAGVEFYRGYLYLLDGRMAQALDGFDRSIEHSRNAKTNAMLSVGYMAKATYCLHVGAVETGLDLCQQALPLIEELWQWYAGYPWGMMSHLYLTAGDLEAAGNALERSLAIFDLDVPPMPTFAAIDVRLAEAAFQLAIKRPEQAIASADGLLAYLDRFNVVQHRVDAKLLKARASMGLDLHEESLHIVSEARSEAEEQGSRPILWKILLALADLEEQLGNLEKALAYHDQARAKAMEIAESINHMEHRSSFLKLPAVRKLVD